MTTDIGAPAAAAAPAAQQIYVWAGGIFDTLIAGLPLYFWLMFMEGIFLFLVCGLGWYMWDQCRAVSGHWDAIRNGTPQALKITKNMRMKITPAVYSDQIFSWENPDEIEKWHLTAPHSVGQLGPVNTAILVDYHNWVENPMINESIKTLAEMWNEAYPDDQIHHYDKYMAYRDSGRLQAFMKSISSEWKKEHPDEEFVPEAVPVKAYFWVNFSEQEQYLPKDEDAASFGGWLRREASKLKTGDNDKEASYGKWILGGCVAIGICILVFSWIAGKGL